jgi:hypothetical protein
MRSGSTAFSEWFRSGRSEPWILGFVVQASRLHKRRLEACITRRYNSFSPWFHPGESA